MTVRVVLADDDPLLRVGVSVVLGAAGMDVVGEAADGVRAVELCRAHAPDVVLMDVRMPGWDGIEATARIAAAGLRTRVLVLTTFPDDAYVWRALRAGAAGFLLKRAAPERLVDAVRTVAAGDTLLDPAVTGALVDRFVVGAPAPHDLADTPERAALRRLTAREIQILRLVAEGLSNAGLAELLGIAESTVKTHVKRILHKIGAHDRAGAVVLAYRSGLVAPGGPRTGPPPA
ncbi:response regulator [Streptomyces sp. NPDC091281]|uniref:response regulator n=1 Tax=Streptomyces sp. NPDC091281 TaxID=3365985 RepID=UPI0037FDE71B